MRYDLVLRISIACENKVGLYHLMVVAMVMFVLHQDSLVRRKRE